VRLHCHTGDNNLIGDISILKKESYKKKPGEQLEHIFTGQNRQMHFVMLHQEYQST